MTESPTPANDPNRLWVLLQGDVAGAVNRGRDAELRFSYVPDYRGALPLSPALPVGDRRFRDAEIRAFMEGLLPDNADVRLRWARDSGTDDDPFSLLSHMGQDCAGAVQFATDDNLAAVRADRGELVPLSDAAIAERLRDLRRSSTGETWTMPREHWSLAGAQGKFTLTRLDGAWYDPEGAAPSTHIVKPGIIGMKFQAAVEFATMRAAAMLGLQTAPVQYLDFEGERAVVITRYDRLATRDGNRRLHQVDLCQAIGVRPTAKYEFSGGPSARRLAELVRRTSTNPEADVARFSDALVFNYLTGSPDGHAKNFSVLYGGRRVRLAPLYDLSTGLPYDSRGAPKHAAFAVGGVRDFGEAYPKHWEAHARDFGLEPDERIERVRQLISQIPDAFHQVLHQDLDPDEGRTLWRRLTERPGRLLSQLDRMGERLPSPVVALPEAQGNDMDQDSTDGAVGELKLTLARNERPLTSIERLARVVDEVKSRDLPVEVKGDQDRVARARRSDLLGALRPAAALTMALAYLYDGDPSPWVRHIRYAGDPGAPARGPTVLQAQRQLPGVALLAAAGVGATAAERWPLVGKLLGGLYVSSRIDGTEQPLAWTPDLVEICAADVGLRAGNPAFEHPLGLLHGYVADVNLEAEVLSSTQLTDAWDRWEHLWLLTRHAHARDSGRPHLLVGELDGTYRPATSPWLHRMVEELSRPIAQVSLSQVHQFDEWFAERAREVAYSTLSESGGALPGRGWRMDETGRARVPDSERTGWRSFLRHDHGATSP